jgi:hypothetical protein
MATQVKDLQVTSSGLTTAATAYSAGDQVGAQFDFTNFAQAAGGGGVLTSIMLTDETDIIGTYTVFLFGSDPTPAADNAAFSISDADAAAMICAPITLGPVYDAGLNKVCGWNGSLAYTVGSTTLYALLRTDAGHTFFGAATSLKLRITALTI